MKKITLNKAWKFKNTKENITSEVCLPHDAMIYENRDKSNPGGGDIAWHAGGEYVYQKEIFFGDEYIDSKIVIEFEGVYKDASIYINESLIHTRPYGYTNFFVDLTDHIKIGSENTITVIAQNNDQPNSRWYSGSGIYRPVHLYVLPKEHIILNSIKIDTLDSGSKTIQVSLETTGKGNVDFDVYDEDISIFKQSYSQDGQLSVTFNLPDASLWNLEHPKLYTLQVKYNNDVQRVRFGIRTISVSSKTGFLLNNERVILRGACIHHDNGILGAMGHPYADKRKASILKTQGYNAIRSAHNPISKAFLDRCDEIGLLVVDEYVDMWYIHKNRFDYAKHVQDWWQQDLQDMVEKDYNHPSVVMYSIGNEVSETSERKGIDLAETMQEYLKKIDHRPVTCGVNIFFNYLYSLGFGVYTEKKAEKGKAVGSEFFNKLAGKLGDKTMKIGAWLPGSDRKTKEVFSILDVAGYNYGILRYKKDLKKYPDRVILGSETFCKDAKVFMDLATNNPAIIGDFVWAGMDYLGEVGIGSWVSEDMTDDFTYGPGWISAGSGRIDLIGNPLSEMAYTRVAYNLDPIRMGVLPVNEYNKKHSPSAWKMSNAIESWSWESCEGMKTVVEVYSQAAKVGLFINDKQIAIKSNNKNGLVKFKTTYVPGTLTSRGYDKNGVLVSETSLTTADSTTELQLIPEDTHITTDDLLYVNVKFQDSNNIIKPLLNEYVELTVQNGELVAFGNACPFNNDGYHTNSARTYYGEALAIIRPHKKGDIVVTAKNKNLSLTAKTAIKVV